jgi:hypothetical protein
MARPGVVDVASLPTRSSSIGADCALIVVFGENVHVFEKTFTKGIAITLR